MRLREIVSEFCNTFQEIHYFVGGFCIGFVTGWIASALFLRFLGVI